MLWTEVLRGQRDISLKFKGCVGCHNALCFVVWLRTAVPGENPILFLFLLFTPFSFCSFTILIEGNLRTVV